MPIQCAYQTDGVAVSVARAGAGGRGTPSAAASIGSAEHVAQLHGDDPVGGHRGQVRGCHPGAGPVPHVDDQRTVGPPGVRRAICQAVARSGTPLYGMNSSATVRSVAGAIAQRGEGLHR